MAMQVSSWKWNPPRKWQILLGNIINHFKRYGLAFSLLLFQCSIKTHELKNSRRKMGDLSFSRKWVREVSLIRSNSGSLSYIAGSILTISSSLSFIYYLGFLYFILSCKTVQRQPKAGPPSLSQWKASKTWILKKNMWWPECGMES